MVDDVEPPSRGDVIWISLNPQAGHEQAGRRPTLVLSPVEYNARVGLALICPITTRIKGYPFETRLPEDMPVSGVVLCDQVESLDWRARRAEIMCRVPDTVIGEALGKLGALLSGS